MKFKATSTHLIWPLGQPITLKDIIKQLQISAIDKYGNDCTNDIQMDSRAVDVNVVGSYILSISVQSPQNRNDTAYLRLHVNVVRQSQQKYHKHMKKHATKYILLILMIILAVLLGLGIYQHHMSQQQALQSSQVAQNTKYIKSNAKQDHKLANQVASLRGALNQYQKDHDETALNNELADLKVENEERLNNQDARELNQLISKIQNNPTDINQYLEALDNSWWQRFLAIFSN